MAEVDKIEILIEAKVKEAIKELQKGENALDNFGNAAKKATGKMDALHLKSNPAISFLKSLRQSYSLVAITIGVAIVALTKFVNGIGKIDKGINDKLNTSAIIFENMGNSIMKFVAPAIDKVLGSFIKFSRWIGISSEKQEKLAETSKRLAKEQEERQKKLDEILKEDTVKTEEERLEIQIRSMEEILNSSKYTSAEKAKVETKFLEVWTKLGKIRDEKDKELNDKERERRKRGLEEAGATLSRLGDVMGGTVGGMISALGDGLSALAKGPVATILFALGKVVGLIRSAKESSAELQKATDELTTKQLANTSAKLQATIDALEKEKQAEMEAYDAKAEFALKEFEAGHEYTQYLAEQEQIRYDSMSEDEQRAYDLKKNFDEERAALETKLADEKSAKEAEFNNKINAFKKQQFEVDKKMKIMQIKIDRAEALSGLKKSNKYDKLRNETGGFYDQLIADAESMQFPAFAKGGSFLTSGPQLFMAGDNPSGREMVTVTPMDSGTEINDMSKKEYHFHGVRDIRQAANELMRHEGLKAFGA